LETVGLVDLGLVHLMIMVQLQQRIRAVQQQLGKDLLVEVTLLEVDAAEVAVALGRWEVYLQLTDAAVLVVMVFNLLLQEQILIMLAVALEAMRLQVDHREQLV
jgi:hypothetical protein